jgi:23S rRNA pseudouridine1911/1915/1917 synthase
MSGWCTAWTATSAGWWCWRARRRRRRGLTKAFAGRDVDKRYVAVVEGLTAPQGELLRQAGRRRSSAGAACGATDGQDARLSYERAGGSGGRSLLIVRLHTGRRHQIRAQLALADHPIVGDPLYGKRSDADRAAGAARALAEPSSTPCGASR